VCIKQHSQTLAITTSETSGGDGSNNNSGELRVVGDYNVMTHFYSCVVERDHDTIVIAAYDQTLAVWNKTTCEFLFSTPSESNYAIESVLVTKDGSSLLCGYANGTIDLRRSSDLQYMGTLEQFEESVVLMYEMEDGTFLFAACNDLYWWRLKGRTPLFASGTRSGLIQVWDKDGNRVATYQTGSIMYELTMLNDGSIVVSSGSSIEVRRP